MKNPLLDFIFALLTLLVRSTRCYYTNPQPYNLSYVVRLLANGQPDPAFTYAPGSDGVVNVVYPYGGKVLIGGCFVTFNGVFFKNLARMDNPEAIVDGNGIMLGGRGDPSFTIGSGPDGQVNAIEVLGDGSIIVGGDFSNFGGSSCGHLIKLNQNGARDHSFAPSGIGNVSSVTLDGDVIVVNGSIRLNADGSTAQSPQPLDATLSPSSTSVVVGESIQFTVTGSCGASLNEVGLEECDSNGTPAINRGCTSVSGTSATRSFGWTPDSPGTYYFDAYAWNVDRSELKRTGVITVTVNVTDAPLDATLSATSTAINMGESVTFTVTGSCGLGLNEIGLEGCGSDGTPEVNLNCVGVSGTSQTNSFGWSPSGPGTYYFDAYAWNVDRSALKRTGVITVTVS